MIPSQFDKLHIHKCHVMEMENMSGLELLVFVLLAIFAVGAIFAVIVYVLPSNHIFCQNRLGALHCYKLTWWRESIVCRSKPDHQWDDSTSNNRVSHKIAIDLRRVSHSIPSSMSLFQFVGYPYNPLLWVLCILFLICSILSLIFSSNPVNSPIWCDRWHDYEYIDWNT